MSIILYKLFKLVKVLAQVGISVGTLVLVGLYSFQSKLIYPSSLNDGRGKCSTPDDYGMNYEPISLKTEDGETLQCFLLKHDASLNGYTNKTVLILSPNAGNIGHALPIVSIFYEKFNYNVFIYSYRGYGKSTGSPTEKGLKLDAKAVMKYLSEDKQYSESSIVLYGRSLGGAVAIYIAATFPEMIQAIVLENTFLSITKAVPHIFPFLRYFTSFVHQTWELEKLVPLIPSNIPVLLLSAQKDEIIPPDHMKQIFELSESNEKIMHKFENSSHNDTVIQPGYWELIQTFIQDKVNPIGY